MIALMTLGLGEPPNAVATMSLSGLSFFVPAWKVDPWANFAKVSWPAAASAAICTLDRPCCQAVALKASVSTLESITPPS